MKVAFIQLCRLMCVLGLRGICQRRRRRRWPRGRFWLAYTAPCRQ